MGPNKNEMTTSAQKQNNTRDKLRVRPTPLVYTKYRTQEKNVLPPQPGMATLWFTATFAHALE